MRERIPTPNINISREFSMVTSGQEIPYHDRIDDNMDCKSTMEDSTPELFYKIKQEKNFKGINTTRNLVKPFILYT